MSEEKKVTPAKPKPKKVADAMAASICPSVLQLRK